jgi:hypothetical protein
MIREGKNVEGMRGIKIKLRLAIPHVTAVDDIESP